MASARRPGLAVRPRRDRGAGRGGGGRGSLSRPGRRAPACQAIAGRPDLPQTGTRRGQFTVSAVITGGTPGTYYNLIGSDCSTASPLPDDVWATGLAGPNGTADLTGYAWTGVVVDQYWLVLDPSPVNPPPGLRGQFIEGSAAPFPPSQAPC